MKIGVISDSHDHELNLEKVLEQLNDNKVEILIHCGDFCAPFMIKRLSEFNGEVYCVFGNIDDRYSSYKVANEHKINLQGDLAVLDLAGKKIAVTHNPVFARGLAFTGDYDIVFYGHTHEASIDKINNTLLGNLGEIIGRKNKPSYTIYDTELNEVKHIILE